MNGIGINIVCQENIAETTINEFGTCLPGDCNGCDKRDKSYTLRTSKLGCGMSKCPILTFIRMQELLKKDMEISGAVSRIIAKTKMLGLEAFIVEGWVIFKNSHSQSWMNVSTGEYDFTSYDSLDVNKNFIVAHRDRTIKCFGRYTGKDDLLSGIPEVKVVGQTWKIDNHFLVFSAKEPLSKIKITVIVHVSGKRFITNYDKSVEIAETSEGFVIGLHSNKKTISINNKLEPTRIPANTLFMQI